MVIDQPKTMEAALQEIAQDESISPDVKGKVLGTLQTVVPPLASDVWIYRLVVMSLGSVIVLTVLGGILVVMTGQTKSLPDGIIAIGSAAVGALAGLLAPSPVNK
jgi:hypothetical protein